MLAKTSRVLVKLDSKDIILKLRGRARGSISKGMAFCQAILWGGVVCSGVVCGLLVRIVFGKNRYFSQMV